MDTPSCRKRSSSASSRSRSGSRTSSLVIAATYASSWYLLSSQTGTSTLSLRIPTTTAFTPLTSNTRSPAFARCRASHTVRFSSTGDRPPPHDEGDGGEGEFGDFMNPNQEESENMQRAREYMSENSLPISFDDEEGEDVSDDEVEGVDLNGSAAADDDLAADAMSALVGPNTPGFSLSDGGELKREALESNPYMAVVSRLSPSELITKFTATAHPRVQNAVRSTILGLIGGLPKMAFDTTTFTTGQRLASLMFQLQMTGYMFKNAEYRLSLQQSLRSTDGGANQLLLAGAEQDEEEEEKVDALKGRVRGKLRIRYGRSKAKDDTEAAQEDEGSSGGAEVEVDAAAYMSELRTEVSKLRDELSITRKEKEEALRKDLLLYIRSLPEKELRSLTSTMHQDVLVAMKGLVNAVMTGIGEGQIGPDTVTEQSGEAMAQLCMWQLAIGYNLRTLEVREEMKKSLAAGSPDPSDVNIDEEALGADLSDLDAFE